MKLILWLVLGLVVVYILRNKARPAARKSASPRAAPPSADPEKMERCAECGVYLPASEALHDATGAMFCSEEHRRRHM